jgi:PII-like signaling protein
VSADGLELCVYFGESATAGRGLASEALMAQFAERGLTASILLRGLAGFGEHRRVHDQRFPDVSPDLPLVAVAVDTRERILAALAGVEASLPRGLVTLEPVRLGTVGAAPAPRDTARLTIYCASDRRRRGHREVVAALRDSGAAGATVLRGIDGTLAGRRRRARLFFGTAAVPMAIVSVGPPAGLRAAAHRLREMLVDPVVTRAAVTAVKHDGEVLAPAPAGSGPGRIAVRLYTRRSAQVDGRALYDELTRRLWEAGAAGVTTIAGDWGYSSDEPPYGDLLGRLASHRPTCSVYVDTPEKVAEVWPVIDELTDAHAIVTANATTR